MTTIAAMMAALTDSPVAAETAPANNSSKINGLPNRRMNCSSRCGGGASRNLFFPYRVSRSRACDADKRSARLSSIAMMSCSG